MNLPFYTDLSEFSNQPNFKGAWNIRTTYPIGSIVDYRGNLYVAQTQVNHSRDVSTLLYHDDFHREDTVSGWGTSTEGFDWEIVYDFYTGGTFKITDNQGQAITPNAFDEGVIVYEVPVANTNNTEILWKFSLIGDPNMELFLSSNTSFENITLTGVGPSIALENEPQQVLFNNVIIQFVEVRALSLEKSERIIINDFSTPFPLTIDVQYCLLIQSSGLTYRVKIWESSKEEPDMWVAELKSQIEPPLASGVSLDFFNYNEGSGINVQEVSIYALPDVSPVDSPDEWSLMG